jgi:hypothetical protein
MSDSAPTPAAESSAPPAALICVDPQRADAIWPHVAPLIARALARGGVDDAVAELARIARDVLSGAALLWLAWNGERILAAAVTELSHVNGVKTCTIVACGGRGWPRFGALIAGLEDFARREGCTRMRICGRRGWARRLRDYALARVILEKKL